jgi:hypothetical protein
LITRSVLEVAGMMNGGAAHVGSDGVTASTRSCTSCRTLEKVRSRREEQLDRDS